VLLIRVGGLRLLNLFGLFSLGLFLFTSSLYAGTFENFQTTNIKHIQDVKTFEDFQTVQIKSEGGSEFLSNQQWNSYEPFVAKTLFDANKPKIISSLREKKIKDVGPKIRIVIARKKLYKKVNIKVIPKDITVDFFSTTLSFNVPNKLADAMFFPQTQKGIGNFFKVIAYTEYNYIINEIEDIKKEMNLNDWGLYLLVKKISNQIFPNNDNANLFTWFVFDKMGYSVRASILRKHIVVVFKTKQSINYTPYYKINGELFYVLDSKAEKGVIYTYSKDSANAIKLFDLSLKELPNLNLDIKSKELRFKQQNKEYIFTYKYNQNIIDFMQTYPQVQSDVFFNAPLDDISYQSIGKSLKEYVDRERANTAINFVLHFVQNAFKYQNDIDQFGKEKFMFAQETLYYDKSDAEDRVALFSYLIKKFFSFSVIGIKYKDHMIAGLHIPLLGDSVMDGKRKFIVADPTYNNANIGQNIAKYKLLEPLKLIKLKKDKGVRR